MDESFFSALKNERVYRTVYATKRQPRRDVIAYIERFYNSRRHSAPITSAPTMSDTVISSQTWQRRESHQSAVRNLRIGPPQRPRFPRGWASHSIHAPPQQ